MNDLDVEIDVPDDEDLGVTRRGRDLQLFPAWLRASLVALLVLFGAVLLASFALGRLQDSESREVANDPSGPTIDDEPIEQSDPDEDVSSEVGNPSPAISAATAAVTAWEGFARTGSVSELGDTFDQTGPQYGLFQDVSGTGEAAVDFEPTKMTEHQSQDVTTVSMELVVSTAGTQRVYAYDFVFRDGQAGVWTVLDRESPGSVAFPPSPAVISNAEATWSNFVNAVAGNDSVAVESTVTTSTIALAQHLLEVSSGAAIEGDDGDDPNPALDGIDPALVSSLAGRVSQANPADPAGAVLSLLDDRQAQAIANGTLIGWTQTGPTTMVAWLEQDGTRVTVVPFRLRNDQWRFDLQSALGAAQEGT